VADIDYAKGAKDMANTIDAKAIAEVDTASGSGVGNMVEDSTAHTDCVGLESEAAFVVGIGDTLDASLTGVV